MPIFMGKHVCSCANGHTGFSPDSVEPHHAPDLALEPVHLEIEIELFIPERKAKLKVTHTLLARDAGASRIALNGVGFQDLKVKGAEFSYDGQTIDLTLKPLKRGDEKKVTLTYLVDEPASGILFSSPDEDYPEAGFWAVTDHETERARHWLATIDHPSVRPTLEFKITAPEDLIALANGLKVGEKSLKGGRKETHWKLDIRCPAYLTCFAVGRFTRASDGEFEGRELAYFAPEYHTEENLIRSFGRTGKIMAWMSKKFDFDFPFPKYYQFAAPGIGGAMENISLVSWDELFVLDEVFAKEFTWLVDQINVHEMAHSYFGDIVVCRDFSQVWLKESWATYTESLWLEDQYGADEAHYDFYRNAQAYFSEADGAYKRPLVTRNFESSWDMFDRHLYPGGACRLHTLRKELGDKAFFRGVKAYLKKFAGHTVETEDFRRCLEAESGRTLTRFFDQWMYNPNYLSLKVEYSWDKDKGEGRLEVNQTQEGKAFAFDLEVLVVVDGKPTTHSFRVTKSKEHCSFNAKSEPTQVHINPEGNVLMKLEFDPGETLLRAGLDSDLLLARIHSAKTLATKPTKANVDAVWKRYTKEKFWGAKQEILGALADFGTHHAEALFTQALETETDPMVLQSLFTSARKYKNEDIKIALSERLSKGDLPYLAARAAWITLGKYRADAPLVEIADAARKEGFGGVEQWGAIEALGETREALAAEILMERTRRGATSARNRAMAATTLGRLGAFLDKRAQAQIVEHLEALLRDPETKVGTGAVQGLVELKARGSVTKMRTFLKRLPAQDAVSLGRLVEKVHAPEDQKVLALENELEELRKSYRGLEDRLAKLEPTKSES